MNILVIINVQQQQRQQDVRLRAHEQVLRNVTLRHAPGCYIQTFGVKTIILEGSFNDATLLCYLQKRQCNCPARMSTDGVK